VDVNDPEGKVLSNVSEDSGAYDGVKLGGVRIDLDVLCGERNERCITMEGVIGQDGLPALVLNAQGQVQYTGSPKYPSMLSLVSDSNGIAAPLYGLTGGFQAIFGTMAGWPYASGSSNDLLVESFAGSHDYIAGQVAGLYDEQGNTSRGRSPAAATAANAWAITAIPIAAPFAIADLIPPALLEAIFKVK
jgi:filamentous hemagglutinin